jgi:hypothetical protein
MSVIFQLFYFQNKCLKRKDFREIALPPWAQEVPVQNPGAPTTKPFNGLTLFRSQFKYPKVLA